MLPKHTLYACVVCYGELWETVHFPPNTLQYFKQSNTFTINYKKGAKDQQMAEGGGLAWIEPHRIEGACENNLQSLCNHIIHIEPYNRLQIEPQQSQITHIGLSV